MILFFLPYVSRISSHSDARELRSLASLNSLRPLGFAAKFAPSLPLRLRGERWPFGVVVPARRFQRLRTTHARDDVFEPKRIKI